MWWIYFSIAWAVALVILAAWQWRARRLVEGYVLLAFTVGLAGHWTIPAVAVQLLLIGVAIWLRWGERRSRSHAPHASS